MREREEGKEEEKEGGKKKGRKKERQGGRKKGRNWSEE